MISLQKTLSGSKPSSSVAGERGEQSRACAAAGLRGGSAPRGAPAEGGSAQVEKPLAPRNCPATGGQTPLCALYKSLQISLSNTNKVIHVRGFNEDDDYS